MQLIKYTIFFYNVLMIYHSNKSHRSLSPYIAYHIDWYLSSYNLPDSFLYYINHTKKINAIIKHLIV